MHHLVVHGLAITPHTLREISRLTEPARVEAINAQAVRLIDARAHPRLESICARARLDFAYVPATRRLADLRLAVMDMDSTLITIECIDEVADLHGIKAEVAAITAASMRGEIDYEQSLRERVRLLRGLSIAAFDTVYRERLRLSPGAEVLINALRAHGIRTLLVSGGFTFFTERLKRALGLDFTLANTPELVSGTLTGNLLGGIVDVRGKARELRRVRDQLGLNREEIIGIGDGANDLDFLAECGISVAYHAKPAVRQAAMHRLDFSGLDGVLNLFASLD